MKPRERVVTALAHNEPDRVPRNLRPSEAAEARLRDEQADSSVDFAEYFQHDVHYVKISLPERPTSVAATDWVPRPDENAVASISRETRSLHDRGWAVCGAYTCGVFEQAKAWFGDADTLTMPFDDPSRLERELDRITDWKSSIYRAYARAGVDIVWIGDDLGMQNGLIMSPEHYRHWYRPRHARIIQRIRELSNDVFVAFHCCGHVTPLIPDLIEIGVDILEAVQPECMDLSFLKRNFGEHISFWGGIGLQGLLSGHRMLSLRDGIEETLQIMAPGGGYIAAPCHQVTDDVSWERILAFHDALDTHGAYPCQKTDLVKAPCC